MPSSEIETLHADFRWGRGRLPRKAKRLWCRLVGHRWNAWSFDWPYDVPDIPEETGLLDEYGHVRDPHPDEELIWVRGCDRECGTMETTRRSLHEAGTLPGDRTTLYDNPIREGWKR